MYLLLSKNNPYLEELNKSPQGQTLQKDFDGMEIDLKNRFKSKDLDIKDNYTSNNFSDGYSEDEDTSNADSLSFISSKLKSSRIGINDEDIENKKKKNKYQQLKNYIHILNIIASILIIISQIISYIENDNYFFDNKYIRKIAALILNNYNFDDYDKINAWEELFNYNNLNLSYLLEPDGNLLPTIISHYILNNLSYIGVKNLDILITYNISYCTYNLLKANTYKNMEINLDISKKNNKLRYFILGLSLTSILFLAASRYLSFFRESKVLNNNSTPFYKSKYCLFLFFESIFLLIFQYPFLNYIWKVQQLDRKILLPLSSVLSAFATFRLFYFFQLINSLSIYDSILSEKILDKFYLSPNILFTMKAYQKSNPFISLIILFIISCVCFSLSIRIFEIYYWETFFLINQDWSFIWNALWCVFVSMTTVGYGDFFPKTHFGRIIVIVSCSVGIYFVSMMMIFLTQKSILSESELKSYKLITRLKIRNKLKDIHSNIIYHGIKMIIIQNKFYNDHISQKKYDIDYSYERRNINLMIEQSRFLSERLKSFDIIPTKDQLYEIAERIAEDIKYINNEVNILKKLNASFLGYTDTQVVMIKYLKKCIQNTKLMLDLIEKKPNDFGVLVEINKKNLFDTMNKIYNEHKKESINMDNINLNKNLSLDKLFEDSKIVNNNLTHYDELFSKELSKYDVTPEEYKTHFFPLFFNEINRSFKSAKNNTLKTMRTIKQMKELKKKIDNEYMQRRNKTNEHSLVYIENELD